MANTNLPNPPITNRTFNQGGSVLNYGIPAQHNFYVGLATPIQGANYVSMRVFSIAKYIFGTTTSSSRGSVHPSPALVSLLTGTPSSDATIDIGSGVSKMYINPTTRQRYSRPISIASLVDFNAEGKYKIIESAVVEFVVPSGASFPLPGGQRSSYSTPQTFKLTLFKLDGIGWGVFNSTAGSEA